MCGTRLRVRDAMLIQRFSHEGPPTRSVQKSLDFPEEWDKFSLCNYLHEMERQIVSVFANERERLQPLLDFDEQISGNASAVFHRAAPGPSIMLFMRMFSVLRAASRVVLCGQFYEARAVMRSALECSVYANALHADGALQKVWEGRDANETSRKAARRAFQWKTLVYKLELRDAQLAARVTNVYESLIDLGAHPNPGGVMGGVEVVEVEGGFTMLATTMGGSTVQTTRAGIAELMSVHHICYDVLAEAIPERVRASGIHERALAIFAVKPN